MICGLDTATAVTLRAALEPIFASAALNYMAAGGERTFLSPLLNPLRQHQQFQ